MIDIMIKRNNQTTLSRNIEKTTSNSTNKLKPIFCFEFLKGSYCLSKCEPKLKVKVIDKIHHLSSLTWQEITGTNRKSNGTEIIPIRQSKCRVPDKFKHIENFLVFHTADNHAILGSRQEQVYYIFGIDFNYTAYKH